MLSSLLGIDIYTLPTGAKFDNRQEGGILVQILYNSGLSIICIDGPYIFSYAFIVIFPDKCDSARLCLSGFPSYLVLNSLSLFANALPFDFR